MSRKAAPAPEADKTPSLAALVRSPTPLGAALRACRTHVVFAAGFSALINLLYLAPTLYMMQVYDRVLPTGGVLTLIFVSLALLLALLTMAGLERIRSRLLMRAAVRLDRRLAGEVLDRLTSGPPRGPRVRQVMRDFDSFRQVVAGPGAVALFDAPWTPIYLIVCFLLHPLIGVLALVGGVVLLILAVANERATKTGLAKAAELSASAYAGQDAIMAQAETVRALGMREGLVRRQLNDRRGAIDEGSHAQVAGTRYSGAIKFLRMALQSAALGLGAWLAVERQLSPGAVIAASVLISRALQPIEQLVGAWSGIGQARNALASLAAIFEGDEARERTQLPAPTGRLALERVVVRLPGRETPVLAGVSINLAPGQGLGVVGPSGAGKSTLARIAAGAIDPSQGVVRLDGADLNDWDRDRLGGHIGYLPQDSALFAGTVRDNIARFSGAGPEVDGAVIAAAKAADAHEMILRLPQGYDTVLAPGGRGLSAGQSQRVALARALYGSPALIVLDEPNAHLDAEGEAALTRAIAAAKARGAAVLVVAHRGGVLPICDRLLVLRDGVVEIDGPRDEVLQKLNRAAAAAHGPKVVSGG
ncbi:MAG TPA: type I secretion system permease/ATPase, partial [Caulobacteraceae bacterium]